MIKVWEFVVAVLLLIGFGDAAAAQWIPAILYHQDRAEQLKDYFRERTVYVSYEVMEKSTGKVEKVRGSAFIIAPHGYAITAKHVLEPGQSDKFVQTSPTIVTLSDGRGTDNLKVVDNSVVLSSQGDLALFQVTTPSTQAINKHFCVYREDDPLVEGAAVTVSSWAYYAISGEQPDWKFLPFTSKIVQAAGPGSLSPYFGIDGSFRKSMSGGAILVNGQVVGIVSVSVDTDGRTASGDSFGYHLRFAKSLWDGVASKCKPDLPGEEQFVRSKNFDEFVQNTCEGTIGWIPQGSAVEVYSVDSAKYRISRRDLGCDVNLCRCSQQKNPKTVRLVINHVSSKLCGSSPLQASSVGLKSTYGAQVVPILEPTELSHYRPEAWFFRNSKLLRRDKTGRFSKTTYGDSTASAPIAPSRFNAIVRDTDPTRLRNRQQCSQMTRSECDDVNALAEFDRAVELGMQWPGYARAGAGSKSTLFGLAARESWTVPEHLLDQDVRVKNWILTYDLTPNRTGGLPVDFAFCVDSDWRRFVVGAFSTERRINSRPAEFYLED